MRLTPREIEVLKEVAAEVFGPQVRLFLFGSRLDDARRGGDVDLYVTGFVRPLAEQLDAKLQFLVKAKERLGEQRIDVVFAAGSGESLTPIQQMAEKTGVPL
ncbi:nucleotidyltransferase domain-containing protein [Desulfuromonas acetexigens]|uniref:nucleotidyltransferase domain-containing protein n=1 Tax=Trichloromonas acetexigens TaxID=38815 RepID=UPI001595585F|nr:nucleotidyltransferase domain-containing protein [Desulfuromonas acetexigens]